MRLWICVIVCGAVLTAQELRLPTGSPPATTELRQEGPALTALEQKDVEIAWLNAQLVALQERLDDAMAEAAKYRSAYNRLMLQADQKKRTPPDRDGFSWDWQERKYVKPEKK